MIDPGRGPRRPRPRIAVAALLLLSTVVPVGATVPGLLGIGARPVSMGGAYVALSDDAYSIFYNPAGLARLRETTVSVGILDIRPDLDPIEGGVIAEDGHGDPIVGSVDPRVEDQLSYAGAIAIPTTLFDFPIAGGALFLLPNARAFTMTSHSASEPSYVRYRNVLDLMYIYYGMGAELTPWLRVGAGLQMYYSTAGEIDFLLDLDGDPAQGELSLSAPWKFAPTAGVQVQVHEGLTLGLSYRGSSRADFEDFHVTPGGDIGEGLRYGFVVDIFNVNVFTPHQITGGLAWEPSSDLSLAFDLTWSDWSDYRDPTLVVNITGSVLLGELPLALDFPSTPTSRAEAHDTWTPRLGAEYRFDSLALFEGDVLLEPSLRLGLFYEVSPLDDQPGVSNLVDNDRWVWSLGLGVGLPHPFGSDKSLTMDLAVQHSILEDRFYRKDDEFVDLDGDGVAETRVLGYPGYSTGGQIWQLGATFTLSL